MKKRYFCFLVIISLLTPCLLQAQEADDWESLFEETYDPLWKENFLTRVRIELSGKPLSAVSLQLTARLFSSEGLPPDPLAAAGIFVNTAFKAEKAIRRGVPAVSVLAELQRQIKSGTKNPDPVRNPGTVRDIAKSRKNARPDPPGISQRAFPRRKVVPPAADSGNNPHSDNS